MKNLLVLHLESISLQRFSAFAASFPNTARLLRDAVVFENYFSSATSTLMVISYLFHGNDFEFDRSTAFEGMRPAGNTRNLFSILQEQGYQSGFIALNGFHAARPTELASWPDELSPVWGTNDFPALFAQFDALTGRTPFALYVWDLITHIEHSQALAPHARGYTDQVRRACAVADDAIGVMTGILERKGLLENTVVVLYGDHGDDYWTHGYKGGMVHATEPYTSITAAPLAIRDSTLGAGTRGGLASTIDIAPTCLALLGIDAPTTFAHAGTNLLAGSPDLAYAQNFTANQPDHAGWGIPQAFAAVDDTHALLASSRGLEFYAHRLDPGNHCNLLQFFDLLPGGRLALRRRQDATPHFRAALQDNPQAVAALAERFGTLRAALARRVAAKREYIVAGGTAPVNALDPACFDRVAGASAPNPGQPPAGAFRYSYRLS